MSTFPIETPCDEASESNTPPSIVLVNVIMESVDGDLEACGCKSKRVRNKIRRRIEQCVNGNLSNQEGMQDGVKKIITEEFGKLQERPSSQDTEPEETAHAGNVQAGQRDGKLADEWRADEPGSIAEGTPAGDGPGPVGGNEQAIDRQSPQSRGEAILDPARIGTVARRVQQDVSRGERILSDLARLQEQADHNRQNPPTVADLQRILADITRGEMSEPQELIPPATPPSIPPRIFDNIDGSILPGRTPTPSHPPRPEPQTQVAPQVNCERIVAIENECGVPICNLHLHFHFGQNGQLQDLSSDIGVDVEFKPVPKTVLSIDDSEL